jgi:hypothetical protein
LQRFFLFAFLDANYLGQEKAYRRLYDRVAENPEEVPRFSLNPAHAHEPPGQLIRFVRRWIPEWRVWVSWSIAPFYGALVIVGLVIYCHACPPAR